MKTIQDIAHEIVGREGGYVNDPDDPGGATKYGVTIHTMRALGVDLDGDGDVDVQDVKLLTIDRAVDIFIKHYFKKTRIDQLPAPLQATVFDMQVNAGANAIRILQRLLRQYGENVSIDGVLGPQTLRAVQRAWGRVGEKMVTDYGLARRDYYFRLADRRPASRKYARTRRGGKGGWIKRAEEFLPANLHMSDAEFAARTRAWG